MTEVLLTRSGKPRWRKSEREYRGKPICVGLEPLSICFRLKNGRQIVRLPIGLAYEKACELAAAALKPKRERRTVRRGALR